MSFRLRTLLFVLALAIAGPAAADTPGSSPKSSANAPPLADRSPTRPGDPEKITFDDLNLEMDPNMVFRDFMLSDRVKDLNGKRVRLSGYMYPRESSRGIKEFILLRQKDCPFGAGGRADHVAEVVLQKGTAAEFTSRPIVVEATLIIKPFQGPDENTWSIYQLQDAKLR